MVRHGMEIAWGEPGSSNAGGADLFGSKLMEAPCLSRIPATGGRGARERSRDDCDGLRARELSAVTVLVRAVGEIDASNSARLLAYVDDHVRGYKQLVLDLSRLTFFGTAGFSVLETINRQCAVVRSTGCWWPEPRWPACCASATPMVRCRSRATSSPVSRRWPAAPSTAAAHAADQVSDTASTVRGDAQPSEADRPDTTPRICCRNNPARTGPIRSPACRYSADGSESSAKDGLWPSSYSPPTSKSDW